MLNSAVLHVSCAQAVAGTWSCGGWQESLCVLRWLSSLSRLLPTSPTHRASTSAASSSSRSRVRWPGFSRSSTGSSSSPSAPSETSDIMQTTINAVRKKHLCQQCRSDLSVWLGCHTSESLILSKEHLNSSWWLNISFSWLHILYFGWMAKERLYRWPNTAAEQYSIAACNTRVLHFTVLQLGWANILNCFPCCTPDLSSNASFSPLLTSPCCLLCCSPSLLFTSVWTTHSTVLMVVSSSAENSVQKAGWWSVREIRTMILNVISSS